MRSITLDFSHGSNEVIVNEELSEGFESVIVLVIQAGKLTNAKSSFAPLA